MNLTRINDSYPKSYKENLAWRANILKHSYQDLEYRLKVKNLFLKDPLFAFNAFFYTYDPRQHRRHQQPFCTYDYQDWAILELVEAITNGYDLPMEKSRDMGASWMVIGTFVWFWLNPDGGSDFLLGSRIQDYVDEKGNMRTLMEKARYVVDRLPKWLRPRGYRKKLHDNFMKLINPETGASITGESNNPNFSTGGRYRAILFDEFAKWEHTDRSAWSDAGDASPCRIPVSTPFGAAGQYYDLVTDETKRKLTLHWSLHPTKGQGLYCIWPKPPWVPRDAVVDALHWWPDPSRTVGSALRSPWYDDEWNRRTPLEVAQNLDIDYLGAGNPVFDGEAGARISLLQRISKTPLRCFEIDLVENNLKECPLPREGIGYLLEWQEPKEGMEYALGVDVAEGKEAGDFSVVKVIERQHRSVVASFAGRVDEVYLAQVLALLAKRYKDYWLGIETNGPGLATFDICTLQYHLTNLFMMPHFDSARASVSYTKGWRTTQSSKNILVSGIKEWLIEGEGWADQRCLREFSTFVKDAQGKKMYAKEGCHDDEVIALGIALQVDLASPKKMGSKVVIPQMLEHHQIARKGEPTAQPAPTREELCFQDAMRKKALMHNEDNLVMYDPYSGRSHYEQMEDLWDF